jgi:hypothetical protein
MLTVEIKTLALFCAALREVLALKNNQMLKNQYE